MPAAGFVFKLRSFFDGHGPWVLKLRPEISLTELTAQRRRAKAPQILPHKLPATENQKSGNPKPQSLSSTPRPPDLPQRH